MPTTCPFLIWLLLPRGNAVWHSLLVPYCLYSQWGMAQQLWCIYMHDIYLYYYTFLDSALSLDLPMVYFSGQQDIKLCLLLAPYFVLYCISKAPVTHVTGQREGPCIQPIVQTPNRLVEDLRVFLPWSTGSEETRAGSSSVISFVVLFLLAQCVCFLFIAPY